MTNHLNQTEKEELRTKLRQAYKEGAFACDLCKEFDVSPEFLRKSIKEIHDPNRRKYNKLKKNETLFDDLNNELSAYALGLLITDGGIASTQNCVFFNQNTSDSYILEPISNFVFGFNNIGNYKNTTVTGKLSLYSGLYIYSKKLRDRLIKIGITTHKSFTADLPIHLFDNINIWHFIRGLWDGDGHFYYNIKEKRFVCGFIGSIQSGLKIKQLLEDSQIDYTESSPNHTSQPMSIIEIGRQEQMKKFGDLIYKNATIFMKRKKDGYDQLTDHLLNKKPASSPFYGIRKSILEDKYIYYVARLQNKEKKFRKYFKNEIEAAKWAWDKAIEIEIPLKTLSFYPNPYEIS